MSDFEALKKAEDDLKVMVNRGDWFWLGLFGTVGLVILLGWIFLIIQWPITFGIITLVLLMPFIIGGIILKLTANKVKRLKATLNKKDDAVEI